MTYPEILEVFEAAARTLGVQFYNGRLADISLATVTAETNLIYLEDTKRVSSEPDINTIEQWRFSLGFFRQDSPSSESMEANQTEATEESRETIFSETLVIARKYLDALYNEEHFQILNQTALTQVTRIFQGTFTGWGCDITILLGVGCDYETSIQDAVYQNAENAPTFQVSIKRGEIYTAPKITVTDSDGTEFEQDANTNVVCTPSASPATARLIDTAGGFISDTSIDPGTTEDVTAPNAIAELQDSAGVAISTTPIKSNETKPITAPDGTVNVSNTDGYPIASFAVKSNETKPYAIPNVAWTNSDGSAESTPYGDAITCTPDLKIWTLEIVFASTNDTYIITPSRTGTIATQSFSGASTDATYGGALFAAWNKALTSGTPLTIVRNSAVATETLTLTGTYA